MNFDNIKKGKIVLLKIKYWGIIFGWFALALSIGFYCKGTPLLIVLLLLFLLVFTFVGIVVATALDRIERIIEKKKLKNITPQYRLS